MPSMEVWLHAAFTLNLRGHKCLLLFFEPSFLWSDAAQPSYRLHVLLGSTLASHPLPSQTLILIVPL